MKIVLNLLETILLFAAIGFAIPIPNSSQELYSIYPSILFSLAAFFISRALRHGIVEDKLSRDGLIGLGYAALESLVFSQLFVLIHEAAKMVG